MSPTLIDDPTFTSSPKRKRHDDPLHPKKQSPTQLSTTIPSSPLPTDEEGIAGSPRTKVANRFKGLQLDGPGEPTFELGDSPAPDNAMNEDAVMSKRVRVSENSELEIPETPQGLATSASAVSTSSGESRGETLTGVLDPVVFKGVAGRSSASRLARTYPSINRLADSKSRGRKRMGTPPLSGSGGSDGDGNGDRDMEMVGIVDADRAALTWHDDEITGHDPNDPDDDGEGINGIGFKPTPAMAYARAEMRRRQLMEYRTRESKEARARRSERRRGSVGNGSVSAREEAARRVHFLEVEASSMITTS